MVGSAAIKQGRSANRKHTYFFFGLIQNELFKVFFQSFQETKLLYAIITNMVFGDC